MAYPEGRTEVNPEGQVRRDLLAFTDLTVSRTICEPVRTPARRSYDFWCPRTPFAASNPRSNRRQTLQPREDDSDARLAGRIGKHRKPGSASMKPEFVSNLATSQCPKGSNSISPRARTRINYCRLAARDTGSECLAGIGNWSASGDRRPPGAPADAAAPHERECPASR